MVRRPRRRPRQINLRLAEPLRHRLVVAAKERQISTNQLMRQLLKPASRPKPNRQSPTSSTTSSATCVTSLSATRARSPTALKTLSTLGAVSQL